MTSDATRSDRDQRPACVRACLLQQPRRVHAWRASGDPFRGVRDAPPACNPTPARERSHSVGSPRSRSPAAAACLSRERTPQAGRQYNGCDRRQQEPAARFAPEQMRDHHP
jgi:hypothetical protein